MLVDRRAVFLDPVPFNGQSGADTLAPLQWELLYGQLRASAADTTAYPSPTELSARAETYLAQGKLPLAVMVLPFDYLDPAAVQDGRLEMAQGLYGEEPYRPTMPANSVPPGDGYGMASPTEVYEADSPYRSSLAVAAAPLYSSRASLAFTGVLMAGQPLTLIIPRELLMLGVYPMQGTTFFLDADDGLGWREVALDLPGSVTYPTSGYKTLRLRFYVSNFGELYSSFSLYVSEEMQNGDVVNLLTASQAQKCILGLQGPVGSGATVPWHRYECGVTPGAAYAWLPPRPYGSIDDS